MRGIVENALFCGAAWFDVEEHQKNRMLREIRGLSENQIMNTSIDDLCNYVVEKYRIEVATIDESGINVDKHDTSI